PRRSGTPATGAGARRGGLQVVPAPRLQQGCDLRTARPVLPGDQLDAALHPPLVARRRFLLLPARHHDLAFLICSASSGRLVMTVVTRGSAMKRWSAGSSSTVQTHAGNTWRSQ